MILTGGKVELWIHEHVMWHYSQAQDGVAPLYYSSMISYHLILCSCLSWHSEYQVGVSVLYQPHYPHPGCLLLNTGDRLVAVHYDTTHTACTHKQWFSSDPATLDTPGRHVHGYH